MTIVGSASAQTGTLGPLSHDQYMSIACKGISLQRHPANQILKVKSQGCSCSTGRSPDPISVSHFLAPGTGPESSMLVGYPSKKGLLWVILIEPWTLNKLLFYSE